MAKIYEYLSLRNNANEIQTIDLHSKSLCLSPYPQRKEERESERMLDIHDHLIMHESDNLTNTITRMQ